MPRAFFNYNQLNLFLGVNTAMTGVILDYSLQDSSGIISGDNGNRYKFTNAQWKSTNKMPEKNTKVDFEGNEDGEALNIYALEQTQQLQQNIVVNGVSNSSAAIVSFVFGLVGIFSSWWLFGIPSIVAIITGHIARSNIKASEGKLDGGGLALVGLILGYLTIGFYLLVIVGVVAALSSVPQY